MEEKSPIMPVGQYAGIPVDQLPNSYLRWIIGQNFSKEIFDAAKKKLQQSDYTDLSLTISRHAIDMFSKRFVYRWALHVAENGDNALGIASFITKRAEEAWSKGIDVSKNRYKEDGTVKLYAGIKWVFEVNSNYPDYRNLITVMSSDDQ